MTKYAIQFWRYDLGRTWYGGKKWYWCFLTDSHTDALTMLEEKTKDHPHNEYRMKQYKASSPLR